LNIIGADGTITNYGVTGITDTSDFNISASGTLTLGSVGNVKIGNASGTVDITNGTVNLNSINGPTGGSIVSIGGNLSAGTLFLGGTAGSNVTIGGTGGTVLIGNTGSRITIGYAGSTAFVNGTLVANNIVTSTATTNMTIGNNITNSTIKIGEFTTGAGASVLLGNTAGTSSNALYGSTVQIGNPNSIVQIGGAGSNIKIGVTGGNVTIGATGTSVIINPGNKGSIEIGTAMRATSSITIGDTSFPTSIYASALTLGGAASNVVVGNTGSQIFIGATGSTAFINGTVLIGASGSGNVVLGQSSTGTTTLNGTTTVTTLDATSQTSGISIGNNSTGGRVQIANGPSFTGIIYIGSASNTRTGAINIGITGSGTVNIGGTNASLNLAGSTIDLNGTTTVATLNSKDPAGAMNVGSNLIGGSLYIANSSSFAGGISIGANSTARAGAINIGTLGTGNINIGNTGITTDILSTNVNIGRNSGGTVQLYGRTNVALDTTTPAYSYLEFGSGVQNSTIDFHNGLYNTDYDSRINSNGGSTGAGKGSLQLVSESLTFTTSNAIFASPITLGSAPTLNTQLGGKTIASFVSGPLTSGAFANSNSFSLPGGTFMIVFLPNFEPGINATATFAQTNYSVSTAINNAGTQFYTINDTKTKLVAAYPTVSTYDSFQHIAIFTLASAQGTLYAGVQFNYTGATGLIASTPGQATIYRIA
jgi:hypothetical protein